jgi:hypothetical protein
MRKMFARMSAASVVHFCELASVFAHFLFRTFKHEDCG